VSHGFVDEMLEKAGSGELRSPVSNTFGMNLVVIGGGEATYEVPARTELGNPLGVIEGGVVTALADPAMAAATTSVLEDQEVGNSCLGEQLQLGVYVRGARRQGASEEEIREVLRQVAAYTGFPIAWNALATTSCALEGLDEPSSGEGSDR
jgi:acyl-coenzyme A thioesterase PaaI-like protein